MKEIKYNNIGTLEFLLDSQNNYYFIPLKKGVDKTDAIDLIL